MDHPDDAEQLLAAVIIECASSEVPGLNRLAGTLRRWRTEIINRHRTGDSNRPTEAMNLLIKQIKRVGRGFTNFANYRLRLLAHCSLEWDTQRTASIRSHAPTWLRRAMGGCKGGRCWIGSCWTLRRCVSTCWGPGSVHAFLAEHRRALFPG